MALLGRSWQTLSPLLVRGKAELQALYEEAARDHKIASDEDLESGRQYALAITQAKDALSGLQEEVGGAIAPLVTSLARSFTTTLHTADEATSAIGGLGGALQVANASINPITQATSAYDAATSLLAGHFQDAGRNALGAIPGVAGFAQAIFGSSEPTDKLKEAQDRLKEATKELVNAQQEHSAKSHEVKDAEEDWAKAAGTVKGIQDDLAESIQGANEKIASQAELTQQAATADLAAASAKLGLESANLAQSKALDEFKLANAGYYNSEDTAAQATTRTTEARINLVRASLAAISAAGELAAKNHEGASAQEIAAASTRAMTQEQQRLEAEYPTLKALLASYHVQLDKTPKDKKTKVDVNTDEADRKLDALEKRLEKLMKNKYDVQVTVSGG